MAIKDFCFLFFPHFVFRVHIGAIRIRTMKNIKQFFQKNKYSILVTLIMLFTFWTHFYHFNIRWGIGNDDSRDVMIAHEALRRGELPFIGSFSSAGPFVFGPFFYWFIMLTYLIDPFVFTIPWIIIALVGIATVLLLMYCGKKLFGNNFAILVGLLAATSPQLIVRAVSLGQHTFISLMTTCMVICLLLFLEKRKSIFAFLVGFCIGAAINFHYQALNLLIFLPVLLFIQKQSWQFRIKSLFFAIGGVLLALSPLIIWDSQQQFANFRNLLDYFLIGQYRLYVPNSWRLFLFTFLPQSWAFVSGGYAVLGLVIMFLFGCVSLIMLIRKKFTYPLLLLLIPFLLLIILNRYYKGERSEGYLLYFLPFILLFTSYSLFCLFQKGRLLLLRQILGGVLLLFILIGNWNAMHSSLIYHTPVDSFERTIDRLVQKYPNQKFTVYDYKASFSAMNQPLALFLSRRHLTDPNGMPIGILCYKKCPKYPMITPYTNYYVADLRKEKNIKRENPLWVDVNPEGVYDDLIGWSTKHELHSTFSLEKYISERIHF